MVYFLFGRPGAGKTTLGGMLADEYAIPYFDCDEVYTSQEKEDIIAGEFTDEQSDVFLEKALNYLTDSYKGSQNCLASQSLFSERQRRRIKDRFGDNVRLVYLEVSVDLSLRRVADRQLISGTHPEREHFYSIDIYQTEAHLFEEPITYDEMVNTSGTIDQAMDELSQKLHLERSY